MPQGELDVEGGARFTGGAERQDRGGERVRPSNTLRGLGQEVQKASGLPYSSSPSVA